MIVCTLGMDFIVFNYTIILSRLFILPCVDALSRRR